MNIRDINTYQNSFWDWTFLNECFQGTNIRVMDIDGAVERNGHFLFIETKAEGEGIPFGQQIFYRTLCLFPRCHVLILWGKPNEPTAAQFIGHKKMSVDTAKVQEFVRRWFDHANKNRRAA